MKLQISFDSTDLEKSIDTALQIAHYADIIEIGSLLIYKYGIKAVETFRSNLQKKILLADIKIIDRGKEAASLALNAGSDWVTVMAGTSKEVIHSVCTEAHNLNKKVMLDLIDSCSSGQSALEAKSLGVDAILFHQAYDESQPLLFIEKWDMVRGNTELPIFVSGKIKRENIDQILEIKPDGIIISKSITHSENPIEEAKFYYELCCSKRS
jgi:3-keto-L-gulonate-6-phosphate decarboxylase